MKWLVLIWFACAGLAMAQTREVFDGQLDLTVTVADTGHSPHVGELVLVTIEGVYRRHITREKLIAPDIPGFSWSQLGPDTWFERQEAGKKVKVFRRRMALFPDRPGTLEIPVFTHRLTLLDEDNKWFDHDVVSEPIALQAVPEPEVAGWWLPVQRLEISDQWSNPPDQLRVGDGVLRVIRLEAHGTTPDFLPPMPELTSPSALIFPHPEQRFVELSPFGPVAISYWRWTIRPTDGPSGVIEPLSIDYFDTVNRVARKATVSPQRVALSQTEIVPRSLDPPTGGRGAGTAVLAGLIAGGGAVLALVLGRRMADVSDIAARFGYDPRRRALSQAVRRGDVAKARAAARVLIGQAPALDQLDAALFGHAPTEPDLKAFQKSVLAQL